jgi:hypothetical protein
MNERRIVRSQEPKTAIYLYLVHKAQKLGLRALALASGEGLLVTGTCGDDRIDLEELAAIGPAINGDSDLWPSFIKKALPGGTIDAAKFDLEGEPFYLTGIGGPLPRIGEVQETLARILV